MLQTNVKNYQLCLLYQCFHSICTCVLATDFTTIILMIWQTSTINIRNVYLTWSLYSVWLLRSFQQWRRKTRAARRERMCMEKARKHHDSKLLSKALSAWNKHHYQCRKHKVDTLSSCHCYKKQYHWLLPIPWILDSVYFVGDETTRNLVAET